MLKRRKFERNRSGRPYSCPQYTRFSRKSRLRNATLGDQVNAPEVNDLVGFSGNPVETPGHRAPALSVQVQGGTTDGALARFGWNKTGTFR
jgi:hypothetical protein